MKNKSTLENFKETVNSKKAEIIELKELYILKQLQNEKVKELFAECHNRILRKHPYYAERSCTRSRSGNKIVAGERILSHADERLMSENDFDEYQKLCIPEYVKEELTDQEGNYTESGNTENQLLELKERLIIIAIEILPDDFPSKELLIDAVNYKAHQSYKVREKNV